VANAARDDGAVVVSVDDNRGRAELDVASIEAMSLQGLDDAIEDRLGERELSDVTREVDERIRLSEGLGNNASAAADEVEPMLADAQAAAFDDDSDSSDGTADTQDATAGGENE
jgi:exonuclease SbcD